MAAGKEPEKLHCVCRALVLRANRTGIEVHCDRCSRRWVVPFAELHELDSLVRFWQAWRAEQKRM
jgi:hypothetical protein